MMIKEINSLLYFMKDTGIAKKAGWKKYNKKI